ncbi:MAG: hypothetical protein IKO27_02520 [Ruminococcus sp.]|nr:hypothetical protein [Ruminococcus sp.]
MYLNRLSNEQKELFLDLCIHAAKADMDFGAEEKLIIEQYCEEMHIDVRMGEKSSFEEASQKLLEISSPVELRIILLEMASLLFSDNEYSDEEKRFMDALASKLGVDKQKLDEIFSALKELTSIYAKVNEFVFG